MSTDLKTQIRHLAAEAESGQAQITMDDVRDRLEGREDMEPSLRPAPTEGESMLSRGAWPAVVAAAVVLIIFGVFAWVFPADQTPPADSLPAPIDRELGYYTTSAVPEGFVLQDMEVPQLIGGSSLTYLRNVGTAWLPGDGGFRIADPFGSPVRLPEDPDDYLSGIVAANPGSSQVDVGGRPGVLNESEYVDGPVTTTLVSVVVVDDQGGVFEISASGMSQEEVLSIAAGVGRVTVDEFVGLGSEFDWDLLVSDTHDAFEYEVPQSIEALAEDLDVVLGMDLFWRTSLARSGSETESPVITTDDGSVIEPGQVPEGSRSVSLYLNVEDLDARAVTTMLEDRFVSVTLSPRVRDVLTDEYIQQVRGGGAVLSEDPYVIQAPAGPDPRFDPSELGDELPLEPAASPDVIPERTLFRGRSVPLASEDRPVIVIGTVVQPGSDAEPVTALIWFTDGPGVNHGLAVGEGIGIGGGSYPLDRYGIGVRGSTRAEGSSDFEGRILYSVPLQTSVVQIVTGSGSYWQRPAGGYGAISWGDTIDGPTSIIAYDAAGSHLGEWQVPAD